jgi:hypothetical protein
VLLDIFGGGFSGLGGDWMRRCYYAEAKRYIITDEIPPELHNLIGRKVTHAGIYRGRHKRRAWQYPRSLTA